MWVYKIIQIKIFFFLVMFRVTGILCIFKSEMPLGVLVDFKILYKEKLKSVIKYLMVIYQNASSKTELIFHYSATLYVYEEWKLRKLVYTKSSS